VIDNTSLPNKEIAKLGNKERKDQQRQMFQQLQQRDPALAEKMLEKQFTGGKRR